MTANPIGHSSRRMSRDGKFANERFMPGMEYDSHLSETVAFAG